MLSKQISTIPIQLINSLFKNSLGEQLLKAPPISRSKGYQKSFNQTFISYGFSEKSKNSDSKVNLDTDNKVTYQQEEPVTIEVSYEEFKKMKELLQELKTEMSSLQNEGNISPTNPEKLQKKISEDLKQKMTDFSKNSQISSNLSQKQQLFFNSLQQQLSFQLIKLNSKEQFTELIESYMSQFFAVKNKQTSSETSQVLEHLKLLYLIFFRYTSLENAKFDDLVIKDLLLQISQHINMLQELQVQKFISVLNDQTKQREKTFQNTFYYHSSTKLSQKNAFYQNLKQIKQILLKNNKVFEHKSRTNMNSEILSLFNHFFTDKQLYNASIEKLTLKELINDENSGKQSFLIYNPLNLSHLLVNSIKNSQSSSVQKEYYSLFLRSVEMKQKNFIDQELNGNPVILEESLSKINFQIFTQLQYQAIVHFFDNISIIQTPSISLQHLNKVLIKDGDYIQRFTVVDQLRILYSFLMNPEKVLMESLVPNFVLSQLERILLSQNSEQNLLKVRKNGLQLFESGQNLQFLQFKKVVMILSQLGIQLFKNVRLSPKQLQTNKLNNRLKDLILRILKYINLVCLQKVELQDFFKEQEETKEKQLEKLILNLNLFEFIVNFNIMSKWSVKLSENPLVQESSVELLKSLVTCYFASLKKIMTESTNLSEVKRLSLAEELIIILLVGKQHQLIQKSLDLYMNQSEYGEDYVSLLKETIGKNQSHKYYYQYLKICEEFKF